MASSARSCGDNFPPPGGSSSSPLAVFLGGLGGPPLEAAWVLGTRFSGRSLIPHAERLAHRWRPAADARIAKRLRRAAIRWSARFGGSPFCALKARGLSAPGRRLVLVSVSEVVSESILSIPGNKWPAPFRIIVVVVAQIPKNRGISAVLGMVEEYRGDQSGQPHLFLLDEIFLRLRAGGCTPEPATRFYGMRQDVADSQHIAAKPNYLFMRKEFGLSAYWGTNAELLALTLTMARY